MIAALLWLAGSAALSFYLSNFADYNATYGSLGAAIGLMMWMWLSTIVVLLGAQLDAVIEREAAGVSAPSNRPCAGRTPVVARRRTLAAHSAPIRAHRRRHDLSAQLGLRLFLGGGGVVRRA